MNIDIGVIGSGYIGSTLARHFKALGHQVSIAKRLVLDLIDAIGFDGIDAGALANSWRQHPGTPAYCRDLSADELKVALTQPEMGRIAQYRAQADEAASACFAEQAKGKA